MVMIFPAWNESSPAHFEQLAIGKLRLLRLGGTGPKTAVSRLVFWCGHRAEVPCLSLLPVSLREFGWVFVGFGWLALSGSKDSLRGDVSFLNMTLTMSGLTGSSFIRTPESTSFGEVFRAST